MLTPWAAKQRSALVSRIPSLPLSDDLHSSILKFTTACLLAGDMALAMGPGRKVFERIWEFPEFALGLCGVLSDLNWGGWKMIALPHVLKHTRSLLQNNPVKTLELLSALHREGRLEGVDLAWRQSFEVWVDGWFGEWNSSDERVRIDHRSRCFSETDRTVRWWSCITCSRFPIFTVLLIPSSHGSLRKHSRHQSRFSSSKNPRQTRLGFWGRV